MNLHSMLAARAEQGRPIRVGLIGAGKFGSMFLAQARRTPGLHLLAVADLDGAGGEFFLCQRAGAGLQVELFGAEAKVHGKILSFA